MKAGCALSSAKSFSPCKSSALRLWTCSTSQARFRNRSTFMVQANANSGADTREKAVWALDFDGVVCNSVGESSRTAWEAAAQHWPDIFKSKEAQSRKNKVLQDMQTVRPVIETGYENLIQIRCLLEGVEADDILANWHSILPDRMSQWKQDRQELVELFGNVRDDWMKKDLHGWLDANGIYPGISEDLAAAHERDELYIVTTKQARFTEALLKEKAKVDFSADRIFSTTVSGQPKSEVLQELEQKHPDTHYHFVEDKLSTLDKVCQVKELEHWQLYLVDWGYNTKQERERAASNPRIHVVNHEQMSQAMMS